MRFEELQREKYEEGYDMGVFAGRASGIVEGRTEGKIYTLAGLVRDGMLPLDEAARRVDMSAADFEAVLKKLS